MFHEYAYACMYMHMHMCMCICITLGATYSRGEEQKEKQSLQKRFSEERRITSMCMCACVYASLLKLHIPGKKKGEKRKTGLTEKVLGEEKDR
jgi:hypothetical protein